MYICSDLQTLLKLLRQSRWDQSLKTVSEIRGLQNFSTLSRQLGRHFGSSCPSHFKVFLLHFITIFTDYIIFSLGIYIGNEIRQELTCNALEPLF